MTGAAVMDLRRCLCGRSRAEPFPTGQYLYVVDIREKASRAALVTFWLASSARTVVVGLRSWDDLYATVTYSFEVMITPATLVEG